VKISDTFYIGFMQNDKRHQRGCKPPVLTTGYIPTEEDRHSGNSSKILKYQPLRGRGVGNKLDIIG